MAFALSPQPYSEKAEKEKERYEREKAAYVSYLSFLTPEGHKEYVRIKNIDFASFVLSFLFSFLQASGGAVDDDDE